MKASVWEDELVVYFYFECGARAGGVVPATVGASITAHVRQYCKL